MTGERPAGLQDLIDAVRQSSDDMKSLLGLMRQYLEAEREIQATLKRVIDTHCIDADPVLYRYVAKMHENSHDRLVSVREKLLDAMRQFGH